MIVVRRAYAVSVIAFSVLALVAVMVANVAYTNRVQRESDARWCDLLTSLDQPQVPAETERGRLVQQQIHKLRADLGCQEGP